MIEHKPFVGPAYGHGPNKILIVGYSHHTEGGDDEDLTIRCGEAAARDEMPQPFFKRIPGYAGMSRDRGQFWNSVAFINFVPSGIGNFNKKNAWASRDAHRTGQARLRHLIMKLTPSHIFLMTPKPEDAYYSPYRLSDLAEHSRHTITQGDRRYNWLDMTVDGHRFKAALLPHPQPARSDHMRAVFSKLLA